jgi:hypothetical protein
LISGPSPAIKAWLLSFNRTQSRFVIGFLTGHNTLTWHLYVMGLGSNPTCRKCGTEEEIFVHVLCECEDLASLRHACLGSFFLDPKDVTNLSMGATWNFGNLVSEYGTQRACFKAYVHRARKGSNPNPILKRSHGRSGQFVVEKNLFSCLEPNHNISDVKSVCLSLFLLFVLAPTLCCRFQSKNCPFISICVLIYQCNLECQSQMDVHSC